MDIRLIAMDLDGTALQADRCSFSPRLIAALDEAHRRGVAIAVITGRQFNMLPPAVQNHPSWENLAVLCNGAQIRKLATGEVLYARNISRRALEQLLKLSRTLEIPIEFLYQMWYRSGKENLEENTRNLLKHNWEVTACREPELEKS